MNCVLRTKHWQLRVLGGLLLSSLIALGMLNAGPAAAQSGLTPTLWLPQVRNDQPVNPTESGVATFYDASGDGSCMFGPSPSDLMVAAMNEEQYNNAAYCGAYVQVWGPLGSVVVRIVDRCPECKTGHLDLSREAFAQIAEPRLGRVAITWQVISPEVSGPIGYYFKPGSNQWWTAVQVRNHRNPIARLEYRRADGSWAEVGRVHYNFFVQTEPGMGPGPYSFRVTDLYGNVLVDSGIPLAVDGTVWGVGQFPLGP